MKASVADAMRRLGALGQSVWLDHLRRSMTRSGALAVLVDDGLGGLTSNPSIFAEAISATTDYDGALTNPETAAWTDQDIFEKIAIEDVQEAADVLRPVYDDTDGADGFASLELAPSFARDTHGSVREARRLWHALNRPNAMIKIPGTREGWPAIEQCLREGINVNVTLLFTLQHYEAVAGAYLRALESRLADGLPIDRLASVASVFISRLDTEIDRRLDHAGQTNRAWRGRAAIANARVVYGAFRDITESERWKKLEAAGARLQRPLWASMATKNAAYSDVLYMEGLIGPDTIATVPPDTLRKFADHGVATQTLPGDVQESARFLLDLEAAGIDFVNVNRTLEEQGLAKFAIALDRVLGVMAERRKKASSLPPGGNAASVGPDDDPIVPSRWRVLAEVGALLDESRDYQLTLPRVLQAMVPKIADAAIISILGDDDRPPWRSAAHRDPSNAEVITQMRAFAPESTNPDHPWAMAIHDGRPSLVKRIDDDHLRQVSVSERHLSLLRRLQPTSYMLVPLAAWGRTMGSLLLAVTEDSRRRYGRRDLTLATEVGRRISLAVDNQRWYRAARGPVPLSRVMPRMGYRYHLGWTPPNGVLRRLWRKFRPRRSAPARRGR